MENDIPLKNVRSVRPIMFDVLYGLSGRYIISFVTPDSLRENDRVVGHYVGGAEESNAVLGYFVVSTDTACA